MSYLVLETPEEMVGTSEWFTFYINVAKAFKL